jgi:hypothetical protein
MSKGKKKGLSSEQSKDLGLNQILSKPIRALNGK